MNYIELGAFLAILICLLTLMVIGVRRKLREDPDDFYDDDGEAEFLRLAYDDLIAGKLVVGNRDANGKLTIQSFESKQKPSDDEPKE